MAPAPIAVFAFNRPDHLRRTLRALAANDLAAESRLTIFCDGPRNAKDKKRTDAVRAIAHAVEGFYSCNVIEQEKNCGLANSIIAGISDILQRDSRIIVLEDDLITSKYFLKYINDGLDVYKNNKDVASIHGWCFPHTIENPQETFFYAARIAGAGAHGREHGLFLSQMPKFYYKGYDSYTWNMPSTATARMTTWACSGQRATARSVPGPSAGGQALLSTICIHYIPAVHWSNTMVPMVPGQTSAKPTPLMSPFQARRFRCWNNLQLKTTPCTKQKKPF